MKAIERLTDLCILVALVAVITGHYVVAFFVAGSAACAVAYVMHELDDDAQQ